MPDKQPRLHLICYDIADRKRLSRLHRFLVKQAIPVQYSVFMIEARRPVIIDLMMAIAAMIDPNHDDVRCYPLPSELDFHNLGRQVLPDGVFLLGAELEPDLFRNNA